MFARLRVVLSTAVTYLVTLSAVLVIVAGELGSVAGIPAGVVQALGATISALGVAITIIRRVTPVLPAARGLLPPPAMIHTTAYEAELEEQLAAERRRRPEFP